ncbi:SDR family oxidoreductase [Candidatus Deferrimicrobium sp.]|uniref:SDR family oxidoreductase n=1 Tax=Candidatus Deferrimicrobium sp. TaxID=3060586 RepID=UPI003C6614FC
MYSAFMQYKEVFVTGGTGPLGRYVCPSLIGHGFLPRLFVCLGSEGGIAPDVRERCRVTPGELTIRESVEMGAQGTSAIVHLAEMWKEQPPRGIPFEEAHVHATANVLHSASVWGIRRLIFVSVAGARPGDPDPYFDTRGRAEALVRGSDRSWTVFRPAPWYDLRDGKPRVSTTYLEALAGAIAESVQRQDTVGRVYEDASTDRFPWKELSQISGQSPPIH